MELKNKLLAAIRPFPLLSECFSDYIGWFCDNIKGNLDQYDLIQAIWDYIQGRDLTVLKEVEDKLKNSQDILGISTSDFRKAFGFQEKSLLTNDSEKINDVLTEPFAVIDLKAEGFTSIKKMPNQIKIDGTQTPIADFTALLGHLKFAIELKSVRRESSARLGQDPITTPSWWRDMFRQNVRTKIKDGNYHVIAQLDNTCKQYACGYGMLVIYTYRANVYTFMKRSDYLEELKELQAEFPQLDYLACKDHRTGRIVFYPDLPTHD